MLAYFHILVEYIKLTKVVFLLVLRTHNSVFDLYYLYSTLSEQVISFIAMCTYTHMRCMAGGLDKMRWTLVSWTWALNMINWR